MYILFTKSGCPYCQKAKELLEAKGQKLKITEVNDSNKEKIYAKIDKKTDSYRYFPVIFNDDKFIGGYTELEKIFKEEVVDGKKADIEIPDGKKMVKTPYKGTAKYSIKTMKYLAHKYNKDCVVIPDKNLNKSIKQSEISLRWNQKYKNKTDGYISVPDGFWDSINECKGRRFIIFPFGFTCADGSGHANYMVYDTRVKSLERFEPYGFVSDKCITAPGLDDAILKIVRKKWTVKKYYKPLDFIPNLGPQTMQIQENAERGDDPVGFCGAWSAFYADLRLGNPDVDRQELLKSTVEILEKRPETLTEFIRNYTSNLI
jgi:glutaredoxin